MSWMQQRRDVKPITYLKNRTADLVREVSEAHRTVTITQNGEARVVVMDVDTYDRWCSTLALLKMLVMSGKSLEEGKVRDVGQAFAHIRKRVKA